MRHREGCGGQQHPKLGRGGGRRKARCPCSLPVRPWPFLRGVAAGPPLRVKRRFHRVQDDCTDRTAFKVFAVIALAAVSTVYTGLK